MLKTNKRDRTKYTSDLPEGVVADAAPGYEIDDDGVVVVAAPGYKSYDDGALKLYK